MSNFPNAPLESIEAIDLKASDGLYEMRQPSWVRLISQQAVASATVTIESPLITNGLNTAASASNGATEVVGGSQFLNKNVSGATGAGDITSGSPFTNTQVSGTTTSTSVATIQGGGSGATFSITGTQSAGDFTVTQVVTVDHGTGYQVGDQLEITFGTVPMVLAVTLDAMMTRDGYLTTQNNTSYSAVAAVNVSAGRGSGGVATITAVVVPATTNGPAFNIVSGVDYTTAGTWYMSGDTISFTCTDTAPVDPFTFNVRIGANGIVSEASFEMNVGETLPFQVSKIKNLETADGSFLIYG